MDNFGMLARDSGFPPKHTNNISKSSSAMADFDYDAIFKNSASGNNDEAESKAKSVKLPVSDKPVYDDGIFDGLPGLKSKSMLSSASPRYEEHVYASMAKSSPKRNQQSDHFNDLMENPIRAQKTEPNKQNHSNSNHRRSFDQSSSPPSSSQIGTSENVQVVDDIWLTVSEIPLFTKPTRSPPPSKPPPPIPRHVSKPERSSLHSNSRKVGNGLGLSSPNSTKNHPQSHRPFQPAAEEEMDSILAMKEAMDRAEAKFRHAKEVREREHTKSSRNRESMLDEERETCNKQAIERAAIEARLKSERAAVQRAQAEARDRAERAAASRTNQQKNDNDLDSFFDPGSRPRRGPEPHKGSIFGGGEFQEIEGESEERRRARLEREQRTQERAAKALAEKNQRDLQSQREQEERHKIGGILDAEIKRWAAGKEGNLRALLSTLQYILWAESGWQAVSMTDLISGGNVKKAYRKATLCIHPDKVQQKGATLQHKYVAEKVFDILKEAWNKFNSEELF